MHSSLISFTDLPDAVTEAFYAGEYGKLTPSEYAHIITRYVDSSVEHIYKIQAEGILEDIGSTTIKLYYTEEGILVKLSSEIIYDESSGGKHEIDEFEEWLPKTPADFVRNYVDEFYPGARYLYIYEGRNFTKVKILYDRRARLLLFDADGSWISTASEIDYNDIPAQILAAFRASRFAEWHIHKITEYATVSDGHYYLLSLENGKNKAELRIDENGNVTEDPANPSKPENPSDGSSYITKADIEAFIIAKYPGATIIKYDYDDDDAEVEIIYDNHKIKVEFELHAQGYIWSQSEWDFNVKDPASLPSLILNTISEKYSSYNLEYLTYLETSAEAPVYEAGLRPFKSKKMIKVKMDEYGNVIAEYGI